MIPAEQLFFPQKAKSDMVFEVPKTAFKSLIKTFFKYFILKITSDNGNFVLE